MKITIDTTRRTLTYEVDDEERTMDLYSKEAFELVSAEWLRIGWSQKYTYTFTWMGIPIVQLPEDVIRIQEVICRCRPDVIVETGVAHGGSLALYATLCKAMDKGRVIGVDVEIRPHNRRAIESHPLASLITLIEGDSVAPDTIEGVRAQIHPGDTVLVVLDSCHTKEHVLSELEAYHDMVTPGSYIVATDGVMRDLHDVPGGQSDWMQNNPVAAAEEFAARHPEFSIEPPEWVFNESSLTQNVTQWPQAWLRRR